MSTLQFRGVPSVSVPATGISGVAARPSLLSPLILLASFGRCTPRFALACVLLCSIATGCGGSGGGSGPTAPTIANVAGVWTGTYMAESASGCGCVSELIEPTIGAPFTLSMEISQSGSTFQGRLTDEDGVWCDLEGTVGSEAFNAEFTNCSQTDPGEVECLNGNRRYVAWGTTTLRGTVMGDRMTGTIFEDDECFDSDTTDHIGVLSVQLGFALQRG